MFVLFPHDLISNKIYFVFSASKIIFHEYMDRIFVRLIASCDKSRNLMLKQSFYASVLYGTLMVSLNINCRSSAVYWKGLRYKLICYEMISYMDYTSSLQDNKYSINNVQKISLFKFVFYGLYFFLVEDVFDYYIMHD